MKHQYLFWSPWYPCSKRLGGLHIHSQREAKSFCTCWNSS